MATPLPELADRIPPLNAGDRLTREQFEWLSDAHPEIKKAELIDGLVYLEVTVGPSHAETHSLIMGLLAVYQARNPLAQLLDNVTVRLGDDVVQPDAILRLRQGGLSTRTDKSIDGPPELAIEVAATSFTYDSHLKKRMYQRAGIPEYLLLQVYERTVEWWRLDQGRYVPIEPDSSEVFESIVFPGLRLDAEALWTGDMAGVLAALDR